MAAALCLVLALYCLAAAGVTTAWPAFAGEPEARTVPVAAGRLSLLLIPATVVVYLLVVAAALRRTGARPASRPVMTGHARIAR